MLQRLERALVDHPLTNAVLFNTVTGAVGEWLAAARYRREYDRYRERYDIDPEFRFNGPGITLYGDGEIELGADSYVGRHSRIQAKEGNAVRIGDNTAVSHYVFCYTQNRVADQDMSVAPNTNAGLDTASGETTIGDDCWIGAFTFLTEGTAVGDNTVVGANAVVTDDLPPHAIAAGAPARVRRFKSYLSEAEAGELAASYSGALAAGVAEEYGSFVE